MIMPKNHCLSIGGMGHYTIFSLFKGKTLIVCFWTIAGVSKKLFSFLTFILPFFLYFVKADFVVVSK